MKRVAGCLDTAWKVSKFFCSVFSPNAEKYGPEKTPHLDTFHTVRFHESDKYLNLMF